MKINDRIFWANTKALREERGWTQPEISEKLGINHRSYNNLERGFASKMPKDLAKKIADLFETSIEALSTGEEPEPLVDPEIVNFWKNAKARRESLELSQATVAERMGMSPQGYQTKEIGKASRLPNSLALKVAEALECSVEELWGNKSKSVNVVSNVNQELVVDSITEQPKETVISSGNSLYDMSHLDEPIQKFISDKENADIITKNIKDLIVQQWMNKGK
ncbi:helix-turn-helix transcriptional regulator [Pelosinus sp. sgz500959]|uniref:helix-turn-helix transcriptional regulator n=1 Tax=Pelosinus sp. sgz500959 TaxID=3242472 RepID=UPI00366C9736